jgi:poly(3-hydroxyalkanoate) synthetase
MIEKLTHTEYNRELALRVVKAVNHLAVTMNECYHLFWNRDKKEILDSLNANLELTLQRFVANSELGAAVNLQLEKTDVATRVIVNMPEGYVFGNGAFAYIEPQPEPEPEPQPEPELQADLQPETES